VRIIGAPIRSNNGELTGAVVAILDIDREKRAETELRELNATLEQRVADTIAERDRIWRLSTELMLVARFDAEIVAVNPAWGTTLGWREEELIGSKFIDLVHPDDIASTLAEAVGSPRGRRPSVFSIGTSTRMAHIVGSLGQLCRM
jgi:PAS domain-containing protein